MGKPARCRTSVRATCGACGLLRARRAEHEHVDDLSSRLRAAKSDGLGDSPDILRGTSSRSSLDWHSLVVGTDASACFTPATTYGPGKDRVWRSTGWSGLLTHAVCCASGTPDESKPTLAGQLQGNLDCRGNASGAIGAVHAGWCGSQGTVRSSARPVLRGAQAVGFWLGGVLGAKWGQWSQPTFFAALTLLGLGTAAAMRASVRWLRRPSR